MPKGDNVKFSKTVFVAFCSFGNQLNGWLFSSPVAVFINIWPLSNQTLTILFSMIFFPFCNNDLFIFFDDRNCKCYILIFQPLIVNELYIFDFKFGLTIRV